MSGGGGQCWPAGRGIARPGRPGFGPKDGETPVHEVQLNGFRMQSTPVTNADFELFVRETGHRTTAEEFGVSAVLYAAFQGERPDILNQVVAAIGGEGSLTHFASMLDMDKDGNPLDDIMGLASGLLGGGKS